MHMKSLVDYNRQYRSARTLSSMSTALIPHRLGAVIKHIAYPLLCKTRHCRQATFVPTQRSYQVTPLLCSRQVIGCDISPTSDDESSPAQRSSLSPAMAEPSFSGRGFQLVVAAADDGAIGKAGDMPWKLPGDMNYFKQLTSQTRDNSLKNVVVMGRKTWESIPEKFRPLKQRINVVLSRSGSAAETNENDSHAANAIPDSKQAKQSAYGPDAYQAGSLDAALQLLETAELKGKVDNVFIIGGGKVYKEAVQHPACTAVHLTRIHKSFEACDTFFPELDSSRFRVWSASPPLLDRDSSLRYTFLCYTRADVPLEQIGLPRALASKHEEYQYLELVKDLIDNGQFRPDRTGTGTFSKFGCTARYNLRHSFPLLTSKRVFWKGVVEELLWFIKGSTNAKQLQDKGVHIWDGNSTREFLDKRGLTDREEGDLGPIYGFQWRHFGAEYKDMHTDYTGQGVDQLANIIHTLKTDPTDRRLILTAWNPAAQHLMALPPCHMTAQFYVGDGADGVRELSCMMYQRSCDVGLGVPFNIASYSLLTCMIAQVVGMRPGEFVHVMGDTHVYATHVEPLKQQLKNVPRHFPTLWMNPTKASIDDFVLEDFKLHGYEPHKTIKMEMAV